MPLFHLTSLSDLSLTAAQEAPALPYPIRPPFHLRFIDHIPHDNLIRGGNKPKPAKNSCAARHGYPGMLSQKEYTLSRNMDFIFYYAAI